MTDFNTIRANVFKALDIHSSYEPEIVLAGFQERYLYLSKYEGLKPLLSRFIQEKPIPSESLYDIITEFNLAYEILKKKPLLGIEYEPIVPGNNKQPDFRIVGGNLLLYVQVKRMRKSQDFEEQLRENPDSDSWFLVDDESQIHKALDKAYEFQPPEEDALYFMVQEITFKASTGDITPSQAVYGKEQFDLLSGRCISRDKSGFFYKPNGQRLHAYIVLRRSNRLRVFDNYEKTLFINPLFRQQKETISTLLDFDVIYDERSLPNK